MVERAELLEAVHRQAPGVVLRRVAGEILLIPVKGKVADMERIFVLNPTGELVWEGLARPCPLREIVDEITAAYDVTEETAEADALEFVEELLKAGLVSR